MYGLYGSGIMAEKIKPYTPLMNDWDQLSDWGGQKSVSMILNV